MVILGGLELVAAGYVIHQHLQNKKERQRLEDEAAALEEEQYRIFPPDEPGRRSQSQHRRRPSHRRPTHSTDRKCRREESPRPQKPVSRPSASIVGPAPAQKPLQRPNPPPQPFQQAIAPLQPQQRLPQPYPQPQPQTHCPPDIQYGWTDEEESAKPPGQHDPGDPPTGWPLQREQMKTSTGRAESSRGRRRRTDSPPVEYGPSRLTPSVRAASRSPPPSYRA
ncbi:hypothetical protein BUE80_DR008443 [Diplocarpon rosae]|nr:hypothetical protein BUE80_DR008443 [Diplocarpon rosae]